MTNLQTIKAVAKANGLSFTRQNATINGEYLYNFTCANGYAVARNWTISSAIQEYHNGDLASLLTAGINNGSTNDN